MSLVIIIGLFGYYANRQSHMMASQLLFLQEGSMNEVLAAANLAIALHASYPLFPKNCNYVGWISSKTSIILR